MRKSGALSSKPSIERQYASASRWPERPLLDAQGIANFQRCNYFKDHVGRVPRARLLAKCVLYVCMEVITLECVALAKDKVGIFGGSAGSGGKLVNGIDGDGKMSLDEGNSR